MAQPIWLLDELAHAGEEHLDPAYAPVYDRKAGSDPTADLARLRALGLGAAHTLVDLGAGTGALALAAAPLCRRVVAADVSAVMLEQMRQQAARRQLSNVEVVQQGFLTYTHQGEPADFVYSRHALHHLPDFWKALALARVAAFMADGGVFLMRDLVFSCAPHEAAEVIEAWLARASADPALGWTRAELDAHLRQEYSTFSWIMEPILERAGLVVEQAEYDASHVYAIYTCRRRG
jgi:ubiquinone/menaquinone biosynthesis C-methylase UbiE